MVTAFTLCIHPRSRAVRPSLWPQTGTWGSKMIEKTVLPVLKRGLSMGLSSGPTVFLWLNVPCHAPAPGKGVQGTRGVHWAAPRGGVQVGGVHAPAPRILYAPPLRYRTPYRQL